MNGKEALKFGVVIGASLLLAVGEPDKVQSPKGHEFKTFPFPDGTKQSQFMHKEVIQLPAEKSMQYEEISENFALCAIYQDMFVCSGGIDLPAGYEGIYVYNSYYWNPKDEGLAFPITNFPERTIVGIPTWTAVDYDNNTYLLANVIGGADILELPIGKAILTPNA